MAKIWPYWGDAFPRWAKAEMRQGRVIIAVTILPDGSLRTAQVLRPSGIDEFDANCMKAVQQAAPFDPFPKNFPLAVLHWELSFDASNPLVR
jgi:TonB family protein